MLWAVAIVLLVGGLVAVAMGWRGRRVGKAPHCRGCGFDLSGIVDRAAACPECGRSLAEGRAVVTGARLRRPWFVVVGAAVFIAAVGAAGLGVSAANPSWNSYKPARLLVFEASALRGPVADEAAAELAKRSAAGTLAPERLAGVIDACLTAQADPSVDWNKSAWMTLLDDAFAAGLPNARQTERYLRNVLSEVGWRLPERALAGYPIGLGRGVDVQLAQPARLVSSRPVGFMATLEWMTLNGVEVSLRTQSIGDKWAGSWLWQSPTGSGNSTVWTDFPVSMPGEWAAVPGENELRAAWRIRTVTGAPDSIRNQRHVTNESFDLSWTIETVHPFVGYETAEEMVRVIGSQEHGDRVPNVTHGQLRLSIPSITPRPEGVCQVHTSFGVQHSGWSILSDATPWVVGRVEFRREGQAWPLRVEGWKPRHLADPNALHAALGPMYFFKHALHVALSPGYFFTNSLYVDDLPLVDMVDVAIIPDLHWAARLGWVETLWGEEIVIRDVPLDWSLVPADLRPAPPGEPMAPVDVDAAGEEAASGGEGGGGAGAGGGR